MGQERDTMTSPKTLQGPLAWSQIWRRPLPHSPRRPLRLLTRATLSLVAGKLIQCKGAEHIHPRHDPFILVLNHSQKLEALYLPALINFLRHGKLVHFLADWNFCLVPGIWLFYHYGEVITVARKPAKPRFLNGLKPLFTPKEGTLALAMHQLKRGKSLGIFPEGTTNRHPTELLKGHSGAARLSLSLGVPVVTAGVTFPKLLPGQATPEGIPFSLEFAPAMCPPDHLSAKRIDDVRQWHGMLMQGIASLSQKQWNPKLRRCQ